VGFQLDRRTVKGMVGTGASAREFSVQVRGDGSQQGDRVLLEVIHYEPDAWAIGLVDSDESGDTVLSVLYVRRGFDKDWGVYQGDELLGESRSLELAVTLAVTLLTAPWQEP
jgi:hypothetical protein